MEKRSEWEENIPFGMTKDDLFFLGKMTSFFGFIYLAGYMNWSISWLLVLIVFKEIRDARKGDHKIKSEIAKSIADNEQNALKGRIKENLSWVHFPDTEFAEWVNTIIRQCWPNINNYFKVFMLESMQSSLKATLEKYNLTGFKFKRIILGDTPFRIINVSVNEENSSNTEIVLDLDIYYSGNCDITFLLSGVKGGISNFQLHGQLRVVLTPLIMDMPLIGGIQCFFLNNPDVNFEMDGALNILKISGLREKLNRAVVEQIAYMMVLPNKYFLKLSDEVDAILLNKPNPKGVLRVHVVEAKNLMEKDLNILGSGKSDPYAVLTVDVQEKRTQTINCTVDPKWDYWCEFLVYEPNGQQLHLRLMDKDDASDEFLGRATVYIRNVKRKGQENLWITLEEATKGKIHLRMTWFNLTSDISDLKEAEDDVNRLCADNTHVAVLSIYIDSCKYLPRVKSNKPDPYVVITCGKSTQESYVMESTIDPTWQQGFTFLVSNPRTDEVHFKIKDKRSNFLIGEVLYNIATLLRKSSLSVYQETFYLQNSNVSSQIKMSLFLQILKRSPVINTAYYTPQDVDFEENAEDDFFDYETEIDGLKTEVFDPEIPSYNIIPMKPVSQIKLTINYNIDRQRVIIEVHRAKNIRRKGHNDNPDTYVKLHLLPERLKHAKKKTIVKKDSMNPFYNETFEYLISQGELSRHSLEVSVCTRKILTGNLLGRVVIDLSNIVTKSFNKVWFDLSD